jgi:hypothetical protein
LAEALLEINLPEADLRAGLLLAMDAKNHDWVYAISNRVMCSTEPVLRWFGLYLCAYIALRNGYLGEVNAGLVAETCSTAMLSILRELESYSGPRDSLCLELEMRIYHALTEAYMLGNQPEPARLYAVKFATIAPAVGMTAFIKISQELLGLTSFHNGQFDEAITMIKSIISSREKEGFNHGTNGNLGLMLHWNGDFLGSDEIFLLGKNESKNERDQELINAYLQVGLATEVDWKPKGLVGDYVIQLANTHYYLTKGYQAQHFTTVRLESFRQARESNSKAITDQCPLWQKAFERAMSTVCSIQIGDWGLAWQSISKTIDISKVSGWVKLFFLSTLIETGIRLPNSNNSGKVLVESSKSFINFLYTFDRSRQEQIIKRLKLLTPYALTYISFLPDYPSHLQKSSQEPLMMLKTRPISVFDRTGMRPIQAVEYTLRAFRIPVPMFSKKSAGQIEGLGNNLRLSYGENVFWFEPVPPSVIILALLEAAEYCERNNLDAEAYLHKQAASDLEKVFGNLPVLQQTEEIPAVETIKKVLWGLANTTMTSKQARASISNLER